MKKLLILALGLLVLIVFAGPASAFDSEFGGYWRTRAFSQSAFSGDDSGAKDLTQVDTRSRLYYTAIFSDDFKFVNKFEWNSTWGDKVGGDIGTDGTGILRIKHSYANFNLGSFNFLVGMQPRVLARGFIFDDDFAGAVATYKGEGFELPIIWMKPYEGGMGEDANDQDVDYYGLKPKFNMGDTMTITGSLLYVTSTDASAWLSGNEKVAVYFLGVDLDMSFDSLSVWFTGVLESGDVDMTALAQAAGAPESVSINAMLLAAGATFNMGALDIHGQVFTATGDDDYTDDDATAFFVPAGQSYYWAEIMGMGTFDNQSSAGSCANGISNIMALNVGIGYKISDALSLTVDLWNASLAEEDADGDTSLGTEIDVKLAYKLIENMKIEVIAASLSAGDATSQDGADNDGNPVEIGTRLSFSF
jgi:hypothetical protein